jgi:hypothetical protein
MDNVQKHNICIKGNNICIYLFIVYEAALSQCQMREWLMNDKLGWVWKEVVMAWFDILSGIFLEAMREIIEILVNKNIVKIKIIAKNIELHV